MPRIGTDLKCHKYRKKIIVNRGGRSTFVVLPFMTQTEISHDIGVVDLP